MKPSWKCLVGFHAAATMSFAPSLVHADALALECRNGNGSYRISYDAEKRLLVRRIDASSQTYRILRTQVDGGEVLVWGVMSERGSDMLAFFGKRHMVKYFFGNGSEITDTCQ